jgi:hypothetical protein
VLHHRVAAAGRGIVQPARGHHVDDDAPTLFVEPVLEDPARRVTAGALARKNLLATTVLGRALGKARHPFAAGELRRNVGGRFQIEILLHPLPRGELLIAANSFQPEGLA